MALTVARWSFPCWTHLEVSQSILLRDSAESRSSLIRCMMFLVATSWSHLPRLWCFLLSSSVFNSLHDLVGRRGRSVARWEYYTSEMYGYRAGCELADRLSTWSESAYNAYFWRILTSRFRMTQNFHTLGSLLPTSPWHNWEHSIVVQYGKAIIVSVGKALNFSSKIWLV